MSSQSNMISILPLVPHFISLLGVQLEIELHTQALLALMTINKPQRMQLLACVIVLYSKPLIDTITIYRVGQGLV